jgi:subtilisin family serine protease
LDAGEDQEVLWEVFKKTVAAGQAWNEVKLHCERQYNSIFTPEGQKAYWKKPSEIATREVEAWEKALKQFDPEQPEPSHTLSKEDLQQFPFATLYKSFPNDVTTSSERKREIRILDTMFRYPLIRVEELFSNNQTVSRVEMVANQLRLMEREKGTLERFYEDSLSVELGTIINKLDYGDGCLFQFRDDLISQEFPPPLVRQLLDKYELSYEPNYLLKLEMGPDSFPQLREGDTQEASLPIRRFSHFEELKKKARENENFPRPLNAVNLRNPSKGREANDAVIGKSSSPGCEDTNASQATSSSTRSDVSHVYHTMNRAKVHPWNLLNVNAPQAWDILNDYERNHKTTTDNITVAFIDTGIDANHPNLKEHVWSKQQNGKRIHGCNFSYDYLDYNVADNHGHGTFCTGIASAVVGHQEGSGLSKKVNFMACKISNGCSSTIYNFIECLQWACRNKATIINFSNGWYYNSVLSAREQFETSLLESKENGELQRSETLKIKYDTYFRAVVEGDRMTQRELYKADEANTAAEDKQVADALGKIHRAGIILVTSAGNIGKKRNGNNDDPQQQHYPSNFSRYYNNIVAIAAITDKNQLWKDSNYGQKHVYLAAPGENITSILPSAIKDTSASERLDKEIGNGTSAAAAHVSGALALMMERFPKESANHLISVLCWSSDLIEYDNNGRRIKFGKINIADALQRKTKKQWEQQQIQKFSREADELKLTLVIGHREESVAHIQGMTEEFLKDSTKKSSGVKVMEEMNQAARIIPATASSMTKEGISCVIL